jgi:hypothetical protein
MPARRDGRRGDRLLDIDASSGNSYLNKSDNELVS